MRVIAEVLESLGKSPQALSQSSKRSSKESEEPKESINNGPEMTVPCVNLHAKPTKAE